MPAGTRSIPEAGRSLACGLDGFVERSHRRKIRFEAGPEATRESPMAAPDQSRSAINVASDASHADRHAAGKETCRPDAGRGDLAHRLGHRIEHLPPFARLYRRAFRSGISSPSLVRAAARLAYYAWDVSGLPRGSIRFSVDVRGTPRSIVADAGNRQYNVLYFQKYRHAYEPEVSTIISTLLPHDGVLYDVGSNWGYFCLMVASSPKFTGHCHAFEPFPSTYGDLADVVRQAGLEPFVTTHRIAVGDTPKQVVMSGARHSGLARVNPDTRRGIEVRQARLDDLELPPPDLLKVDVEGMEDRVFRGASRILADHKPTIVFESTYGGESQSDHVGMHLLLEAGYEFFVPSVTAVESEPHLRLVPMPPSARDLFRPYLNIVAVHRDRRAEIVNLILER